MTSTGSAIPAVLGVGAFADVIDVGDGTVIKAYRRQPHALHPAASWTEHDRITRRLFEVEAQAYERLQTLPEIERYVPRYHGRADPVVLHLPHTAKGELFQGCGLRLEKLIGNEAKIAHLPPDLQAEAESVLELIREAVKRVNVWDGCGFYPGSRTRVSLIDFALWDDYAEVTDILSKCGSLPEHVVWRTGLAECAA